MASYSDDFAGSGALSANWVTVQNDVANLTRSSGVLRAVNNIWTGVRHQGLLATDNQFVQAAVASNGWAAGNNSHQIWARIHNGAAPGYEFDFYAAIIDTQGTSATWGTYGTFREVNGNYSQILYLTAYAPITTGEVMRMGIEGVLVFAYRNGTLISGYPVLNRDVLPDSDHRRAGISLAVNSADLTTIGFDDWSCGDTTTPTYAPSDNFNRANSSTDLGSIAWTNASGLSFFKLVGNAIQPINGNVHAACMWAAWAPIADQWSEITIKTSTSGSYIGPAVRISPDPNVYDSYYIKASINKLEIWKCVGGGHSAVHSGNTTSCVAGDVIRLEAEGTTLRALRNGSVVITATDTSLRNGFWGLAGLAVSASGEVEIDAWAGGEIALTDSPATAPTRTGTASQLNGSAGDGSTSVTVPADCNYVVAFWVFWNGSSGSTLASLTLGGSAFTIYRQNADVTNAYCAGVAGLVSPATGTQTAAWSWASNVAVAQGGKIILVYVTGADITDPWREAQHTGEGGTANGAVPPMIAIDSKTTDLVLAFGEGYEQNIVLDGTAFIDGAVLNHLYYDATQVTPSFPRTTVTMTNPSYSTIAAISIKGVAAAAAAGYPWHTYAAMMGA